MKLIVITLALLAVATSEFTAVPHKTCGSKFEIKNLEISGCTMEGQLKCVLKAGSTNSIRITFVPNTTMSEMTTFVRAKMGESYLPYNLKDADACKFGGLTCPLEAGKEYVYQMSMPIEPSYPKDEDFQVSWAVGSNKKNPEVCTLFNAIIVA